ncbi:Phospholipase A2 [Melipona quadrifasciata]|uniref:phospholipase A2 n=1 Tax=Melipona quadrifasciata TaxID=166423 RepID=A0A0M9A5Z3_9HYME|nr:Phospholipase A2 [Melipona quadrifasciata]
MISITRIFLLYIAVNLAAAKFLNSDSTELKKTYVTSIEKSIRMLINFENRIQKNILTTKNNIKKLTSGVFPKSENKWKKSTLSDILNPFKLKIKAIYPGTYWCGDGDISPNKEDLGFFKTTESSCNCDDAFYRCLKEANNILATHIGTTYFNILRPQCFKEYYPIVNCKKYLKHHLINKKCKKYDYNFSLPQIMQWFDNPDFL